MDLTRSLTTSSDRRVLPIFPWGRRGSPEKRTLALGSYKEMEPGEWPGVSMTESAHFPRLITSPPLQGPVYPELRRILCVPVGSCGDVVAEVADLPFPYQDLCPRRRLEGGDRGGVVVVAVGEDDELDLPGIHQTPDVIEDR